MLYKQQSNPESSKHVVDNADDIVIAFIPDGLDQRI